eukprot:scaffold22591_cov61-Skeletonema_dohrnii-CCMP3373.AAC.1
MSAAIVGPNLVVSLFTPTSDATYNPQQKCQNETTNRQPTPTTTVRRRRGGDSSGILMVWQGYATLIAVATFSFWIAPQS